MKPLVERDVVVELNAPQILEVDYRRYQVLEIVGEPVVPEGHSHPVMRARRHEAVRLHGSEEIVLRELRIIRAHGPTDEERGLPIGVALRLPQNLTEIEGDVPGLLLVGVLNALPGDEGEVVWIVGRLIPRRVRRRRP